MTDRFLRMRRRTVYKGSIRRQTPPVLSSSPAAPSTPTAPESSDPAIARTLWLLAIAAMASSMSMRLADPMLPDLARSFGGQPTDMVGVITWFSLAYALLILIQGPLGDQLGKLNVIMVSSLVAAIVSLACALAPSLPVLNTLRFINGAACAGLIPLSLAWIGDNVEIAQRQQTLARFASASIGGLILGQVSGGIITDTLGWRVAFVLPAVIYLIAFVVLWRAHGLHLPSDDQRSNQAGGIRIALAQTLTNYRNLFSDRWARTVMIIVGLEGACYFGAIAFVPTFLHDSLGIALWQAGVLIAVVGVGGLIFSAAARSILAALNLSQCAALGGCLCMVGLLIIISGANMGGVLSWWIIGAGCLATGLGFTMMHNTLQTHGTQMRPEARGTAIAGFVMALFGGQAIGTALSAQIIPLTGYATTIGILGVCLGVVGLTFAAKLRHRST